MAGIETLVSSFKELNKQNDDALAVLAKIAVEGNAEENACSLVNSAINGMMAAVHDLIPQSFDYYKKKSSYLASLDKRIEDIFDQKHLRLNMDLLRTIKGTSPSVRKNIVKKTLEGLTKLNRNLEGDFDLASFSISDLATPHDVIRYLHRLGTFFLFDPNGDSWRYSNACYEWHGGGMQIKVIDALGNGEQYAETNPFIKRFREIGNSGKFTSKKRKTNEFYALALDESLSMQMPLGCHYATLKIDRSKEGYTLSFKYTDTTGYSSSESRSEFAKLALTSIVMNTKREGNIISGRATIASQQDALDLYEMILRFAVSLQDVDCLDSFNKDRLQEAVDAFNAGVVNMYDYLSEAGKGSYVKYAKKHGCYLEPKEPAKETPVEEKPEEAKIIYAPVNDEKQVGPGYILHKKQTETPATAPAQNETVAEQTETVANQEEKTNAKLYEIIEKCDELIDTPFEDIPASPTEQDDSITFKKLWKDSKPDYDWWQFSPKTISAVAGILGLVGASLYSNMGSNAHPAKVEKYNPYEQKIIEKTYQTIDKGNITKPNTQYILNDSLKKNDVALKNDSLKNISMYCPTVAGSELSQ
jgi:hypothetical protein